MGLKRYRVIGDENLGNDSAMKTDGINGSRGADTLAEGSRKAKELSEDSYQSFHVVDRQRQDGAEYYQGKRV